MSKLVQVITAPIALRLEQFTTIHGTIKKGAEKLFYLRFRAGLELISIKDSLEHGQFGPFCKEHIIDTGIASNGALHNYMSYAQELTKFPTVGNLVEKHLLPNGTIPEEAEPELQTAIHDLSDGKDITAFMRSLGVIRDKQPNEHHERKPVDVQASEEEQDRAANEDWLSIHGDVLINEKNLQRLAPETLDTIRDTFIRVTKQMAILQKANKKKKRGSRRKESVPAGRPKISLADKALINARVNARWAKVEARKKAEVSKKGKTQ